MFGWNRRSRAGQRTAVKSRIRTFRPISLDVKRLWFLTKPCRLPNDKTSCWFAPPVGGWLKAAIRAGHSSSEWWAIKIIPQFDCGWICGTKSIASAKQVCQSATGDFEASHGPFGVALRMVAGVDNARWQMEPPGAPSNPAAALPRDSSQSAYRTGRWPHGSWRSPARPPRPHRSRRRGPRSLRR